MFFLQEWWRLRTEGYLYPNQTVDFVVLGNFTDLVGRVDLLIENNYTGHYVDVNSPSLVFHYHRRFNDQYTNFTSDFPHFSPRGRVFNSEIFVDIDRIDVLFSYRSPIDVNCFSLLH